MPETPRVTLQALPFRPFLCMLRTAALTKLRSSKHKLLPSLVVLFFRQWQRDGLTRRFRCHDRLKVYIQYTYCSLACQLTKGRAMQDLWGEEAPQPSGKQPTGKPRATIANASAQDCYFYGHSWTVAGMLGEKLCTVCGVKGYCPCCTPTPPSNEAKPFLCTRHSRGRVSA